MKKEKQIISGWAGRIKEFFFPQKQTCVALVPEKNGEAWGLLYYRWSDDDWQLTEHSDVPLENNFGTDSDEHNMDEPTTLEKVAGQTVLELAKKGWQDAELIYALLAFSTCILAGIRQIVNTC